MFVALSKTELPGGNGMGTICISHPPLNVLSYTVIQEVEAALDRFLRDAQVQVIKLTTTPQEVRGKTYFSAGADVNMLAGFAGGPPDEARWFFDKLMALGLKLDRSPKPVVAVVDGICYGGALELALMCDQILATPQSVFAFKEINHRIFPGWGGTQRAARRMGTNRFPWAFEMVASGKDIDAQTALQWRLVDGVGPIQDADRVMASIAMAPDMVLQPEHQGMELPDLPPATVAHFGRWHSRKAVDLAYTAMIDGNRLPLEQGLVIERDCFLECFTGEEAQKTLAAFRGGEKPEFPSDSVY